MEVTVGDVRYDRYHRRINTGIRLMSHGARAQVASALSELTLDQLSTLRKRWMCGADDGPRGPAPSSYLPFFKSEERSSHAAIFVGIYRAIGGYLKKSVLEAAECFCTAFEIYRAWEPRAVLEFDQCVLLGHGAAKGDEVELMRCAGCRCALVVDKLRIAQLRCGECRE